MKRTTTISKLIHSSAFALALAATLCGCENKHDKNGDLDGMWQMLEWRDKEGHILKTKEDRIFYSVQLTLMKFINYDEGANRFKLAYFRHTADSLIVFRPVDYPSDRIVGMQALKQYGVPKDGAFKIETLTGSKMLLSSGDSLFLTFRRY